jgi:hypothetical protein
VIAVRSRVVDRAAGVLLLAGAFANFAGVIMFSILGTERGLLMAAMVLSALGSACSTVGPTAREPTYSCGSV